MNQFMSCHSCSYYEINNELMPLLTEKGNNNQNLCVQLNFVD